MECDWARALVVRNAVISLATKPKRGSRGIALPLEEMKLETRPRLAVGQHGETGGTSSAKVTDSLAAAQRNPHTRAPFHSHLGNYLFPRATRLYRTRNDGQKPYPAAPILPHTAIQSPGPAAVDMYSTTSTTVAPSRMDRIFIGAATAFTLSHHPRTSLCCGRGREEWPMWTDADGKMVNRHEKRPRTRS